MTICHQATAATNCSLLAANATQEEAISLPNQIVIGALCGLAITLAIMGNLLVITVIISYKRLKNTTNYIFMSLAIADLTVSFLVMIPAMIEDVMQKCVFTRRFCLIYNAFDITCCTASILHLLLVAIDRYVAIFNPLKYHEMIRKWHVFVMVAFLWTLSLCMSFIPLSFGWNVNADSDSSNQQPSDIIKCQIEANTTYAIVSSSLSFYVPLVIMSIVYVKIYIVARRQAIVMNELEMRSKQFKIKQQDNNEETENNALGASSTNIDGKTTTTGPAATTSQASSKKESSITRIFRSLRSIEKRRTKDTKAIKTLGIIMGIFILCWLPFFINYIAFSVFDCAIEPKYDRIITWIGYTNSFINPIIYALTNRDYRKAYISTIQLIGKFLCPTRIYESVCCVKKAHRASNRASFMGRENKRKRPHHNNAKKATDNNSFAQQAVEASLIEHGQQKNNSPSRSLCCCSREESIKRKSDNSKRRKTPLDENNNKQETGSLRIPPLAVCDDELRDIDTVSVNERERKAEDLQPAMA